MEDDAPRRKFAVVQRECLQGPAVFARELVSRPVLLLAAFLCIWSVSWSKFALLPFAIEWQFILCILVSYIHQSPSPGWYMPDVRITSLPYGKQLFARPSHHVSANMAFLVSLSYLYPLPEVVVPLLLCVFLAAATDVYMGFSGILDVVYGTAVGGTVAALVYCTGFSFWILSQPSWTRFLVLASPIPAAFILLFAIRRFVPGVSAQHTDMWVSSIKRAHPDPNLEVVIDDRKIDVILPNLALLFGLSIGTAIVPPTVFLPAFLVGVGLAVYVLLAVAITVSVMRSITWLCVLSHFLLGCWATLALLIN